MRRKDKERLLEQIVDRQESLDRVREDNARLRDALAQMKAELDLAKHELKVGRRIQDDYSRMSDRLHEARAAASIARSNQKILEEALASKKAGDPNWENVAVMKMRKANY
jgi:hypothetical protein